MAGEAREAQHSLDRSAGSRSGAETSDQGGNRESESEIRLYRIGRQARSDTTHMNRIS